jgi:Domain of unknown function (DUF6046)
MPDLRILVNNLGLRGVVINFLNDNKPLDVQTTDVPYQAEAGNGAVRLDTGSANAQVYNYFGLPVFCPCRLIDPDNADNVLELMTVIIEVSMTKNIDTVAVNGVDGTIKTYINDGDFDVRIRGMITSDNQTDYPLDAVKKLIELFKIRQSLKVVCEYLVLFGIYELAIMDYQLPQLEGTQNTQLFDISALSDKPIELLEETL